jgi:REG-2-like HAD superfamily hydrolase
VKRFDAVLFDAGETLLHPDPSFPELISRFIRERGHRVSAGQVVQAEAALAGELTQRFVQGTGWSLSVDASRAHWTAIYRSFAEHLGLDDEGLADHLYERFREPAHYTLFPEAAPTLATLHEAGLRLGVVSNFEAWLEGLLAALEVVPMLDALVVSGIEGLEKPDPAIFERALERIGVEPERTVYVGDSPEFDIAPARALGMHALLIDRKGRYDPDLWPVVRSLRDVVDLVQAVA